MGKDDSFPDPKMVPSFSFKLGEGGLVVRMAFIISVRFFIGLFNARLFSSVALKTLMASFPYDTRGVNVSIKGVREHPKHSDNILSLKLMMVIF